MPLSGEVRDQHQTPREEGLRVLRLWLYCTSAVGWSRWSSRRLHSCFLIKLLGINTVVGKKEIYLSAEQSFAFFWKEEEKKSMAIYTLWRHNQLCVVLSSQWRWVNNNGIWSFQGHSRLGAPALGLLCVGYWFHSSSMFLRKWALSHGHGANEL